MKLKEYLARIKETKRGKPERVKEALEVYIELWDKALRNGTVSESDEVDAALSKVEKAGGLYRAGG